jgi:nicotinamide-nucleotide amidase
MESKNFWIDSGTTIQLFQLMKAAGLMEDYKDIRFTIAAGKVSVNGKKVDKQREELSVGDEISFEDTIVTIVKQAPKKEFLKRIEIKEKKAEKIAVQAEKVAEKNEYDEKVRHGKISGWSSQPLKAEVDLEKQIENLSRKVHGKLSAGTLTLSVAESCTGGMLAEIITSHPGCSSYFLGGVVTYSNKAKQDILKVHKKTLDKFGAVSKEVCEEMTNGCSKIFDSTISLSITGLAGPSGGTKEKPVGTVHICCLLNNKMIRRSFTFSGNREKILKKTINSALKILEENIF